MPFPRTSKGLPDIEAYVNLLAVNPEAAELMENELINEDEDTINYFYDNVETAIAKFKRKNNEELIKLNARHQELEAKKHVYVAAYEKSMQGTLANVRTKDGRHLTDLEKEALNRELAQREIGLLTQQSSMPQKTAAQLKEEEQDRHIALLMEKVRLGKEEEARNPRPATLQKTTTNHNKTSKNRGCTIF